MSAAADPYGRAAAWHPSRSGLRSVVLVLGFVAVDAAHVADQAAARAAALHRDPETAAPAAAPTGRTRQPTRT